jgi:hypothetical protein
MRNEYADRLGYARELDLLFDFYDEEDLKNMIELIIYHAESEELLDLINELVGELVENNVNLQDVVY